MDNQRQLPQAGGVDAKLATSAIQSEHKTVARPVRREPGDSVITTKFRMEGNSDVPCKVPRFQYVDFPSLHQCIKQLSVPPLEGWLASSPPVKVTANHPNSPKEKVPKFKYVDYPSLHHCIQQLSVPPLETWSSKPMKTSPGGLQAVTIGVQCPGPQVIRDRKKNKGMKQSRAKQQRKENTVNGSTVHAPVPEQAVLQHMQDTPLSLALEKISQKDSNMQQMHSGFSSDCVSSSGSGSEQELDKKKKFQAICYQPSVYRKTETQSATRGATREGETSTSTGAGD